MSAYEEAGRKISELHATSRKAREALSSATEEMARRVADLKAAVAEGRQAVASSHARLQRVARQQGGPNAIRTERAFEQFRSRLEQGEIREALAYVVGLSDYRFISVFRFRDGKAFPVVFVDKLNPAVQEASEIPDTATYCRFVRERDSAFVTFDAPADSRADGHPAQHNFASYCGIPILTPEGELIGVMCHYDTDPRDAGHLDLELQLQVASALAQSGKIPPYPTARP